MASRTTQLDRRERSGLTPRLPEAAPATQNQPRKQRLRKKGSRSGFTLVEALVSVSIAVTASSSLYLALAASLQNTQITLEQIIAQGIAEQIADEVAGTKYSSTYDPASSGGPYQYPFSANAYEQNGNGRERFNDTDDFHNFTASPPQDLWGITLGQDNGQGISGAHQGLRHPNFYATSSYLKDWDQEIELYYVDEDDPSVRLTGSQTSNFRAIEVRIYRTDPDGNRRILTSVRRVLSYLPSPY